MIVLNYPNNPTGKILNEKLQDDIIELAKKNNYEYVFICEDDITFLNPMLG